MCIATDMLDKCDHHDTTLFQVSVNTLTIFHHIIGYNFHYRMKFLHAFTTLENASYVTQQHIEHSNKVDKLNVPTVRIMDKSPIHNY